MNLDEEAATVQKATPAPEPRAYCFNFWHGEPEIAADWAVVLYRTVALGLSMYTLFRYSLEGKLKFVLFTTWTLAGACTTFFLGACSAASPHSKVLNAWTSLFYHVFTAASLLGTIFYWALVYGSEYVTWHLIYPHGVALGLLMLDILCLSRMVFRPWYIAVLATYCVAYIVFMFIRLAVTGQYTYEFLDPRANSRVALILYYCALVVGAAGCGLFVLLLSRFSRIFRKIKPRENQQEHPRENRDPQLP